MIALEIKVNGNAVQRASVGDHGILTAGVRHMRLMIHGKADHTKLVLQTSGQEGASGEMITWEDVSLVTGDVVTIRVVDENDSEFQRDQPTARVASESLPPSMRYPFST